MAVIESESRGFSVCVRKLVYAGNYVGWGEKRCKHMTLYP